MQKPIQSYSDKSGQLKAELFNDPPYLLQTYLNLEAIETQHYLQFLQTSANLMEQGKTGRILADFSNIKNYKIGLRVTAINNFKLMMDKAPYLLVAFVKGSNLFDNMATEAALKTVKPLSKKFLEGKMFEKKEEAIKWLTDYSIPEHLQK